MPFSFPRIYPILDSSYIPRSGGRESLRRLAGDLADAGVTLLEYRNKSGSDAELLEEARILREALPVGQVKLILDDRVELVEEAGFDGVHVDAGDMPVAEARRLLGPERIIGTFAGSDVLIPGILQEPADYFAVGPVYATKTKQTDRAAIGPEGVRRLRAQAGPGVVFTAAAGITLDTAPLVLEAGANTVAVAAALFDREDPASEFRRWLQLLG